MAMESNLVASQAAPVANTSGAVVLSGVLSDLYSSPSSTSVGGVAGDLCARAAAGIGKYGVPLMTQNGRNMLVDLYQEMLDAVMYAKGALMESPGESELVSIYLAILDLTKRLRQKASS